MKLMFAFRIKINSHTFISHKHTHPQISVQFYIFEFQLRWCTTGKTLLLLFRIIIGDRMYADGGALFCAAPIICDKTTALSQFILQIKFYLFLVNEMSVDLCVVRAAILTPFKSLLFFYFISISIY